MKQLLLSFVAASASMALTAGVHSAEAYQSVAAQPAAVEVNAVSRIPRIAEAHTEQLSKDVKLQIIIDENGTPCKRIVKAASDRLNTSRGKAATVTPKDVDPENSVLNESFEGWDGETENWLPDGWTQKVSETIGDIDALETWHVSEGVPMLGAEPYDGNYMMGIQFDMLNQQDEWLVTPSVTVGDGHYLYFAVDYGPVFLYDLVQVDWETMQWIEQVPSATLKVLASTDGGNSWTELLDLADLYMGMSFEELLDNYSDMLWYDYAIDLSDYVGEQVQFAFEYVGTNGNTLYVDAVAVGAAQPEACFVSPVGSLHFGLSEEYMSYTHHRLLIPAGVDQTWINTSSVDSEMFTWSYDDGNGENNIVTTDETNLTVKYSDGLYVAPTLTAATGDATSEYGDSEYLQAGNGPDPESTYGLGTYNIDTQSMVTVGGSNTAGLFGFNSEMQSIWSGLFVSTPDENNYATLSFIGNMFDAPAVPYELSRVTVFGTGTVDPLTVFNLEVVAIDESGTLGETLAIGECVGRDVVFPVASDPDYCVIPFNIQYMEDGLWSEGSINVDCAILVKVSATNIGNTNVTILNTYYPDPNELYYGYFGVDITTDGETTNSIYGLPAFGISTGTMYGSFIINIDATFPSSPAGVADVAAGASAASVVVDGDNFVITAPDGINAATVYNIAGQAVAASEVRGMATIDGSSLAKGVYIVRFDDGSSVKVVK